MGLLPDEGAHLVGVLLGQVTYGIYIYVAARVFVYIKRRRAPRVVAIFMISSCIVTTATQVIRIWTTYDAFVQRRNPNGARGFYQLEYLKVYSPASKCPAYLNGALADALLCWRMYVVWNRNKRVLIIPLCFLSALIGCMTMSLLYEVKAASNQIYCDKERQWLLTTVFLTLSLNIVFTTLIIWKIWRIAQDFSAYSVGSGRLYWRIILAMAESGILYTATLCTYCVVAAARLHQAEVIVSYFGPCLTGITPALVFLRLFSRPESTIPTTIHHSDPNTSTVPSETINVELNSIPMTIFTSLR
ncbi:hypothetical protein FRC03_006257 [Tulasnella sp. 419]|nr:hypothetical protein FRC03_006257 [Tulasnella sp. 419]